MQGRRIVAYASCQLKLYGKNYHNHDLKLVDVIFALKIWRCYV